MSADHVILNSFFTQTVFRELVRDGSNEIYSEAVRRFIDDPCDKSNGQIVSEIYQYMSHEYRNEYVYQNTMLNRLLLGIHSPRTTTALTQIPVGKSIADFILINGDAVVYEIKTELDSFTRLKTQLIDYYRAFDYVCLVTSERQFDQANDLLRGTPVGVYVLTDQNRISRKMRKLPVKDD